MTANQIAFARAREEKRANMQREHLQAFEQGIKMREARAAESQAQTAFYNALTNRQKAMIDEQKKDSAMFKDWTAGAQNIVKSLGSVVGALGAIFG